MKEIAKFILETKNLSSIDDHIKEGLKINSKTKVSLYIDLPKDVLEKLEDVLCYYFQTEGVYNQKLYSTKLEILDQKYDKNIHDMIFDQKRRYFYVYFYNMLKKHQMLRHLSDIKSYIRYNNDELYEIIDGFVLL